MADETLNKRGLKIILSGIDAESSGDYVAQQVNFVNVFDGNEEVGAPPSEQQYENFTVDSLALLNYSALPNGSEVFSPEDEYYSANVEFGLGAAGGGATIAVSIYKQEVVVDKNGKEKEVTPLVPVVINADRFSLRDYNVASGRRYRYVIFPANAVTGAPIVQNSNSIGVNWTGWSITELHPIQGERGRYYASLDDVWLFKYNMQDSSETQRVIKTEQQTLGTYPRFSHGQSNYVSGQVSALLGDTIIPASYLTKDGKVQNEGGYIEKRRYLSAITSNDAVDMINAWRKIVYSKNPKLLKNQKGESFLVTLIDNSNQIMDKADKMPTTVSFSWVQINDAQSVIVTDIQTQTQRMVKQIDKEK